MLHTCKDGGGDGRTARDCALRLERLEEPVMEKPGRFVFLLLMISSDPFT